MNRPSVIPEGMRLLGDVEGEGDLAVLGAIEGDVRVDGALVVETSGVIKGQVQARTIVVRGVLVGDGTAADTVRVEPGARMVGDARAPRVSIVDGALFRGRVEMSSDAAPRVGRSVPRRRTAAGELATPSAAGQLVSPTSAGADSSPSAAGQLVSPTSAGAVTSPGTASSVGAHPAPVAARRGPPAPNVPVLRRTEARRAER